MNIIMKKYRNILVASFIAVASVMAVSCLKDEENYQDESGANASRGTIVLPYHLPSYDVVLNYTDSYPYSSPLLTLDAENSATKPNTIGHDHPTAGGGIYTEIVDTVDLSNRVYHHTLTIHYDNVPVGDHAVILYCPLVINKGNKSYHDYYLDIKVPIINLDTTISNQFEEYGAGYDYRFEFTVPDKK